MSAADPSVPDDAELHTLADRVGQRLGDLGLRLTTAESCTGGWIAKALTDVAGSSGWFESAYVTYSNRAKAEDLGVPEALLAADGAVSRAVVAAMAEGACRRSGAPVAIAVSGIAGPEGGTAEKPVGLVWLAWAVGGVLATGRYRFSGDREAVRRRSVAAGLSGLLDRL